MVHIRRAEYDDLDFLMTAYKAFASMEDHRKFLAGYSADAIWSNLRTLVNDHIVLIAENGDHSPVGLIAGEITGNGMNPNLTMLVCLGWWVLEEERNQHIGSLLLDEFGKIAKNISKINYVVLNIDRQSKVSYNTLEALGYKHIQDTYAMEI